MLAQNVKHLVARQVGQILNRAHLGIAEFGDHRRRQALHLGERVGDARGAAALLVLAVALRKPRPRARAQFAGKRLVKTLNLRQLARLALRDLLKRRKTLGGQQVRDHVVNIQRLGEELGAAHHLLLTAGALVRLGQQFYLPARQVGGEIDALSLAADGERQLILGDDDLHAVAVLVKDDLCHLRRRERVHHKSRGVGRPRHNVNLLALQLADHSLNTAAAHAHTRADRINRAVMTDHRNLRATPGIARHRFYLDDAVVDLGHLLRKQLGHELRMTARKQNLRTALVAANLLNVAANAVAGMMRLARNRLALAHESLGVREFNVDIAVLNALDESVDNLADAVLVLLVLAGALGLADMFDDGVLDGAGGDSSHVNGGEEFAVNSADLVEFRLLRSDLARLFNRDLGRRLFNLLNDGVAAEKPHLAGDRVNLGADVMLPAVLRLGGLLKGEDHRLDDLLEQDAFFARDRLGNLKQLAAVKSSVHDRAFLRLAGRGRASRGGWSGTRRTSRRSSRLTWNSSALPPALSLSFLSPKTAAVLSSLTAKVLSSETAAVLSSLTTKVLSSLTTALLSSLTTKVLSPFLSTASERTPS